MAHGWVGDTAGHGGGFLSAILQGLGFFLHLQRMLLNKLCFNAVIRVIYNSCTTENFRLIIVE